MTIPSAFALLIAAVSFRTLPASVGRPASLAAIPLAAITTRTDSEDGAARRIDAGPLTEHGLFGILGWSSHGASISLRARNRKSQGLQNEAAGILDDGRLRRDDVVACGWMFRKLRFQMIADRHSLSHEQDSMETVVVAGFVGTVDLVLESQNGQMSVRNGQWLHTNMKPLFCSMR
jgi:hypothetical protein